MKRWLFRGCAGPRPSDHKPSSLQDTFVLLVSFCGSGPGAKAGLARAGFQIHGAAGGIWGSQLPRGGLHLLPLPLGAPPLCPLPSRRPRWGQLALHRASRETESTLYRWGASLLSAAAPIPPSLLYPLGYKQPPFPLVGTSRTQGVERGKAGTRG